MADSRLDSGPVPVRLKDTSKDRLVLEMSDLTMALPKKLIFHDTNDGQLCLSCSDRCPGFEQHDWRNICQHCKCPRNSHDLSAGAFVDIRERIGWDISTIPGKDSEKSFRFGYTWVPPGLTKQKVDEYMQQLDNNKIPRQGSVGKKYHDMQLIVQLPRHDLSSDYCRHLKNSTQLESFAEFCRNRDDKSMDIGCVIPSVSENTECQNQNCKGEIEVGELAVSAPKFSKDQLWHAACFTCSKCQELLVDLCYCFKDGSIYCERHYAELVRPRCAACDELIFSTEYTKAMDQDWHTSHFACFKCDVALTGHRYVLRDDHAYCIVCYEKLFAHTCEECKTLIGTDSKDLSYKELHWHEKCFQCSDCHTSLVDRPFATQNNRLYCSDCHDNNFAARCDHCDHIFRAGMKKFEYMGKQWHEHCFCCQECREPISTKSFIPRDQSVICVPCYEQQYAQRCVKCNGVINKGGITYKNASWHRDCFTCSNCSKILAGEKFTSQEDKPYCADCYGALFAKKCDSCTKPITGLGSTKFVSFEERHWHSDCFVCAKCRTSLVGKGFLLDENEILCPECGNA